MIGAISLSMPINKLSEERLQKEYAEQVVNTATQTKIELRHK
jgi:DNA-binding IclR family transcriptional regulator